MEEEESGSHFSRPESSALRLHKFNPLPPIRPPSTAGGARPSVPRLGVGASEKESRETEHEQEHHPAPPPTQQTPRTRPLYRAPSIEPSHASLSSAGSHSSERATATATSAHNTQPLSTSAPATAQHAAEAPDKFTVPMPPSQPRPARGRPHGGTSDSSGVQTGSERAASTNTPPTQQQQSLSSHNQSNPSTSTMNSSNSTQPQASHVPSRSVSEPIVVSTHEEEGPELRIAVKLSTGIRLQCVCRTGTSLSALAHHISQAGEPCARFVLATSEIPRRVLPISDESLSSVGITVACLVHVVPSS
eukprot:m.9441 g.9441  ORF g.9441 m.9441 type:complete len:304 (+) comp5414_c0_seq1:96-1007(+)